MSSAGCATEPLFDAVKDARKPRFGHAVPDLPADAFTGEQAPVAHDAQMLRSGVGSKTARIGEAADGVLRFQQQRHHAQALGMRKRAEAVGGIRESLIGELRGGTGERHRIKISGYLEMSIFLSRGVVHVRPAARSRWSG